ncbi:MAG: addiction module antitoxin [Ardenticatenia bacterium]|nr:addiction module antitoxin [Ardenticatenia bacterium]
MEVLPHAKKLTITVDAEVYDGLYRTVGAGRISHFIEELVRPYVVDLDLDKGYAQMAADEAREREALGMVGLLVGGTLDETW